MFSDLQFAKDLNLQYGVPVHGNYGGPGYTGGRVTRSERGNYDVAPTDELDALYRDHDFAYEHGSWSDRRRADTHLAASAVSKGFKGALTSAVFAIKGLGYTGPSLHAPDRVVKATVGQTAYGAVAAIARNRLQHALEGNKNKGLKKKGKLRMAKRAPRRQRDVVMRMTSQPVARSMSIMTRDREKPHPEHGIIRLGVVQPSTTLLGAICFLQDLNPLEIGGRLALIASTYANYRFLGGKITYIPIVPTSTSGQLIVTRDHDPTNWPMADVVDIDAESQKANRMTVAVRDPWAMPCTADARELYVREDPQEARTTSPGFVTVSASSNLSALAVYGTIEFEYSYVFYNKIMNPATNYLVLQSAEEPDSPTDALFPLRPDGTSDGVHSTVLSGDNAWKPWVYPLDNRRILIPPYTNCWIRLTVIGTGLSAADDIVPNEGLVVIDYHHTALSGTFAQFYVAQVHTLAQPGTLRFTLGTAPTTISYRELVVVHLAWPASVNTAPQLTEEKEAASHGDGIKEGTSPDDFDHT